VFELCGNLQRLMRPPWEYSVMADILVQCPRSRKPVPTGLKAEWVVLQTLPSIAVPFVCRACGQTHEWKREQAWIGHPAQLTDLKTTYV
jgi:hypothetical protein